MVDRPSDDAANPPAGSAGNGTSSAVLLESLQAMSMRELLAEADRHGLDGCIGLSKPELVFRLVAHRLADEGTGYCEGILDVLPDGFGFLRSRRHGYRAGPDDVYVSPSQIRRLNLKRGHRVAGPVRPPREGERFCALLHVDTVNGGTIQELRRRVAFDSLTPLLPSHRLPLAFAGGPPALHALDALAPIGRGQRVLMLAPPQSGRTRLLTEIAIGLRHNHPDLHLVLLLIDERPEDVHAVARALPPMPGRHPVEVVASTFDEPPQRHVDLCELVLDEARRMVEAGEHVALLVDSLTGIARAYNVELPHSGKILCAGLDAVALQQPKRLFGAARCTEEAGSLTIVATALVDTGSHADDVIAGELRGKGGTEITLDRRLAEIHVYPPLDVARTGTRREELLLDDDAAEAGRALRRRLLAEPPLRRIEMLLAPDATRLIAPAAASRQSGTDRPADQHR